MLKFKQLDEISKGLRDKYVARAVTAHGGYNMARRNTTGADQEYFARKEKNTQKGISRALDDKRLNKESTDMCNVCGQTPCNCTSIEEAKATMCGRCGTKHVHPSKGGKCPALEEGIQQTLRKVVPGYAKRQIDNKMDAGKFGKTDADKDTNFQRYKKIQDKLKESSLPKGSMVPGIPSKRDTMVKRAKAKAEVVPVEKAKATYGVGYRQESVVNEIKMSDDEYKSNVDSYGKRATNLLKHSWSQHDVSKEKAKAGDKEGAVKASTTGSRAHKLFLKAKEKHLQNPERAAAYTKKVMSGASDYYKSKKPGEYTGDSFDPTLTNSNPYIQEGLVDESSDKLYAGYQADVLSLKAKAAAQEKKHPVDIQKLAARLKAANQSQGNK